MSLAQVQQAMGDLLWEKAGWRRLDSARQWKAFLKTNDVPALAAIGREPLALYESLLRNTVHETLSAFFPFCKQLLGSRWPELAERYRRAYPNRSYQLHQCARHFPDFIAQQGDGRTEQLPFLPELALYEWLEVHVENLPPTEPPSNFTEMVPTAPSVGPFAASSAGTSDTSPDRSAHALWDATPVWNPDLDLRTWRFHIPRLIEFLRATESNPRQGKTRLNKASTLLRGHWHILIYRDPASGRARFFEINALAAHLMELSRDGKRSYREAFAALKADIPALGDVPLPALLEQGQYILAECRRENILWGSAPAQEEHSR